MLKNLLLLSGFSTFAVIIIIGLNIYHNHELSTLPSTTQVHVVSIPGSFDKKTLNNLKKRVPINVDLLEKSSVVSEDSKKTGTTTPTTTPTPTILIQQVGATGSATPI
jgi:hypothetical protein